MPYCIRHKTKRIDSRKLCIGTSLVYFGGFWTCAIRVNLENARFYLSTDFF